MMGKPQAESTRRREAYFLDYAETVRSLAGDIPIAVTGGFRSRTGMQSALADGLCDMVGLGGPARSTRPLRRCCNRVRRTTSPHTTPACRAAGRWTTLPAVRSLEGALDLQWHTDQLARMGDGLDPDVSRGLHRTLASTLRRNGLDALRLRRRGPATIAIRTHPASSEPSASWGDAS